VNGYLNFGIHTQTSEFRIPDLGIILGIPVSVPSTGTRHLAPGIHAAAAAVAAQFGCQRTEAREDNGDPSCRAPARRRRLRASKTGDEREDECDHGDAAVELFCDGGPERGQELVGVHRVLIGEALVDGHLWVYGLGA